MSANTGKNPDAIGTTTGGTVSLIAGREISTRVRSKSFLISTLIMVGVFAIGAFLPQMISSFAPSGPQKIAVADTSLATAIQPMDSADHAVTLVTDSTAVEKAVESGDASIGLVVESGKPVLLTNRDTSKSLTAQITALLQADAQTTALRAAGVDTAALNAAVLAATPSQKMVGNAPVDQTLTIVSFIISLLLFVQILTYGGTVAQGVVEEKQSRVVEILLSTVSARQLLIGKVIGIGAVGLMQLVVILTVGAVTSSSAGYITLSGDTIRIAVLCIAWFIPGYLFYAFAYAAAGALVSRIEEIGQSTTVLTMFIMISYIAAVFAMQDITAAWVPILSMIPPFSAILMPMLIAAGIATWWQIATSLVLLVLATVGMSLLGARIYRRSILRMGSRVPWREALAARD